MADTTLPVALTGLKAYATGGLDAAAGNQSGVSPGADGGGLVRDIFNPNALTDNVVGVGWNLLRGSDSNLAHVGGNKPYIEVDLKQVRTIYSIALWGRADVPEESNNLRIYVSETPFPVSAAAYADLEAKSLEAEPTVKMHEVEEVDVAATTAFTDTLKSIENLVGTAVNDTLTGNGNANILAGGAGNDTVKGEGGDDLIRQGMEWGNDTLQGGEGRRAWTGSMAALATTRSVAARATMS